MSQHPYIIDTPGLQSLQLKYSSAILTLIFWIIWFYLWLPLITLIGWWFQIEVFQSTMITEEGFQAFLDELPVLAAYVLILVSSLALWSAYNYFRFKGVQRRKALPPVTPMDMMEKFQLDKQKLEQLQQGKIINVYFDHNGEIEPVRLE